MLRGFNVFCGKGLSRFDGGEVGVFLFYFAFFGFGFRLFIELEETVETDNLARCA